MNTMRKRVSETKNVPTHTLRANYADWSESRANMYDEVEAVLEICDLRIAHAAGARMTIR